jgi:hypothetical protein
MEPILNRRNTALQMLAIPPVGIISERYPYRVKWAEVSLEKNRFDPVFGLRTIFWTKAYTNAYRAGEQDITIFEKLLAVGEPRVDFRRQYLVAKEFRAPEIARTMARCATVTGGGLDGANGCPNGMSENDGGIEVRTLEQTPSYLRLRVAAPSSGLVIVRDAYDSAWESRVDGTPANTLAVDLLSKGVLIAAGVHIIEFSYRPWAFLIAVVLFLSLAALLPICWAVHFVGVTRRNSLDHPGGSSDACRT